MTISNNKDSFGYVALEFALAMGLLVIPTALILLQIPSLYEQNNRLEGVAAIVSNECANNADNAAEAVNISRSIAQQELAASSALKKSRLVSATCTFQRGRIDQGNTVTSNMVIEIPGLKIPGGKFGKTWRLHAEHISIVPKYRSIDD